MSRRLISVLLAVACVILSGVVLRMAEDNPWQEYDYVDVPTGEWVSIDRGISMRVTNLTLGRDMTKRGEVIGVSAGRFVLVEGEIRATKDRASGFKFELQSGERSYRSIDENGMITPVGQITTYAAVFELPQDAFNDLTVVMEDVEIINGYTRRLRHAPKISDQDVESSRLQKVELPSSEARVIN
ncbi:MAG: hypothetical protein L0G99_09060 [Propionibacteriales bacterium]|nr:hypothetical protein [Propionibacteriales bacterium]